MILEYTDYVWARGAPITYVAGTVNVDLKFLSQYLNTMKGPVVREVKFLFSGDVTSDGGTLPGNDGHKLFNKIEMRDKGGVFFDLPGAISRQVQEIEYGYNALDLEADPGATTQDASYVFSHSVHFEPWKAARPKDYGVPLNHFTSGGNIALTLGPPVGATVTSGTVTPVFRLQDERRRELKPRMVWREYGTPASQAEFTHPVQGSIRCLFFSSNIAGNGYTALSGANYDTFESSTLRFGGAFPMSLLWRDYIRRSAQQLSGSTQTGATILDTVAAKDAMPIITPSVDQNIGQMIAPDGIHCKLEATITSGKIVTCTIEDRNAELALEWTGFNSTEELEKAILTEGYVVEAKGDRVPASEYDPRIRRRLPLRLPGI